MQINRLFEIVYILLSKKSVTAKELSERFDVSVRTIYRDVETLSGAGIPIYMNRGKGGGISLLENFVLNKSVLSESEQSDILTALSALSSLNWLGEQNALSKLSGLFGKANQNWIKVNFYQWHGFDKKFETIKEAILSKKVISFDYYAKGKERTGRRAEPLQLQFNAKAWYLYAFCLVREQPRTFKISRMENVSIIEQSFDRILVEKEIPHDLDFSDFTKIVLKMDSSQAYRIFDEFSDEEVIKSDDGSFTITLYYPEDEWVYGYILSFGHCAEVLEPPHIRDIIIGRLKKSLDKYL